MVRGPCWSSRSCCSGARARWRRSATRNWQRFTNAFATTPLCSPSRASLLTGQYAHRHGILDNTLRPSHALPVFPLALQRAGYRTGFFGKWHMGNDDTPRPGFERWVGMGGQGEAIDPSLNIDGTLVALAGGLTDNGGPCADYLQCAAGGDWFQFVLGANTPTLTMSMDSSHVPAAGLGFDERLDRFSFRSLAAVMRPEHLVGVSWASNGACSSVSTVNCGSRSSS